MVCVCIISVRLAVKQLVGDGATDNETKTLKLVQKQSKEEEEEEEEYFSTYSHFSIHLEMLSDRVRTEAYRNFILKNPALFRDKVSLVFNACDFTLSLSLSLSLSLVCVSGGAGCGMWYRDPLSLCCQGWGKAGHWSRPILNDLQCHGHCQVKEGPHTIPGPLTPIPCRENGYEDRIKLTRGKLEEVQLPVDKVYTQTV